jgi:hypothetical protein
MNIYKTMLLSAYFYLLEDPLICALSCGLCSDGAPVMVLHFNYPTKPIPSFTTSLLACKFNRRKRAKILGYPTIEGHLQVTRGGKHAGLPFQPLTKRGVNHPMVFSLLSGDV